jgi:hypothetical protein
MKPLITKTISLTEDFLNLINQWNDNPKKTSNQKKHWSGDKIFEFVGIDHPNTLKLLSKDGFDDQPVFDPFTTEQLVNAVTNREVLISAGDINPDGYIFSFECHASHHPVN